MKFKNLILSITLLLTTVLISTIAISQNTLENIVKKGEIRVGMTGKQPPFCMMSKNRELIGFEVDLAEILAQSMNVKLRIVRLPFAELLPALKEGKIDVVISGMTITPKRTTQASFVGPYVVSGKSVLTKSAIFAKIEEAKDLNKGGMRLAALEGSTSEEFVKKVAKSATLTLTQDYDEAIQLIIKGEVDALVADYPSCALAQISYPDENFTILDEPLTIESIGMALPMNEPQMLNYMQNFYNSILMSGYLEELTFDWFEDGSWLQRVEMQSLLKRKD